MTVSQQILMYWPIIIYFIGGVISVIGVWVNMNNKITALKSEGGERDKEIAELKGVVKTMQPDLGTIKTDIAVIKNTLEYIKGSVQGKPTTITSQ